MCILFVQIRLDKSDCGNRLLDGAEADVLMLTEHSALWSALRTLELTRQFTSARVEAAKVYHTNIPGKHVDGAD